MAQIKIFTTTPVVSSVCGLAQSASDITAVSVHL